MPGNFDATQPQLLGSSSAIVHYENQERGRWRIIAAGSTDLAHAFDVGTTMTMAAMIMEQRPSAPSHPRGHRKEFPERQRRQAPLPTGDSDLRIACYHHRSPSFAVYYGDF